MNKIFFDTDAIYAFHNFDDPNHHKAVTIFSDLVTLNPQIYLGTNILAEVITMISQQLGKAKAIALLQEFRQSPYQLIHPSQDLIGLAEDIFCSIASKNISYSDCISFAIMKFYNLKYVFSFDRHFKRQDFIRFGIDT